MSLPSVAASEVRRYGRSPVLAEIPPLSEIQRKFYAECLQAGVLPQDRELAGLEAAFQEILPITSYDGSVKLEYLYYELGEPRHTPGECRQLGLSYAAPLKVRVRLVRDEPVEEDVYLGNIPIMLGGGEFIINGAERVVVSQLQRSPGIDFSEETHSSGKRLQQCRVIPERGSWMQIEVSSRELLFVKVDRSGRIPVTMLLRALSEEYSTTADILRALYKTKKVEPKGASAAEELRGSVSVEDIISPDTGEVIVPAGERIGDPAVEAISDLKLGEVEVIPGVRDEVMLNTLRDDDAVSHEEAIMKLYIRLRPGNPPQMEKAQTLFHDLFQDPRRYNLGRIGRFRINRKFKHGVPDDQLTLTGEDFLRVIKQILGMRSREAGARTDDIDHLGNRRVRTIKDLVTDEFRKGMIKLRRSVRERMSLKDVDTVTPRTLINSQTVSSAIDYFFARGELSQVVDQSNPLSMLTNERRLSALGPGGLNRKRAGFEVRDVHTSHYGRICPIETPEGTNIGLIVSLSLYAAVSDIGFLVTPYAQIKKGKVTGEIVYLRADEEQELKIAQADVPIDKSGKIERDRLVCRIGDDIEVVDRNEVDYMDVAPQQLVGVAASLIPFLEHDDANRALMGSNMQRQAVPLLKPEVPLVCTGIEPAVARNSSMVATSDVDGTVDYVDGFKIVVRPTGGYAKDAEGPTEHRLKKYFRLNERTCLNQTPIVREGDKVKVGQPLTQGAATSQGELALGSNTLAAFMVWEGYNFEDAIVVSEALIRDDRYTSIHLEEFAVEIRETKLGREEITRDIPNVAESALRNLDEDGIVQIGTRVRPGDILVGKIAPKSKTELSSEEKLLHAIFGRAGEDVKNDSMEVKPGVEGYVIEAQRFVRRNPAADDDKGAIGKQIKKVSKECDGRIATVIREKFAALSEIVGRRMVNRETGEVFRVTSQDSDADVIATDDALDLDKVELHPSTRRKAKQIAMGFDRRRRVREVEKERVVAKMKRGDELPTGVLELVKVYVAVKRKLAVGDKMAGRHGNKGVVSKIVPEEDMPFLEDGTPIEMILNPLGVPSRMNFGQILETHLGWAAHELGFRAVCPVFDGATEEEIREALKEAGLPEDGRAVLYDGRTGKPFDQKVTVGYIYMMKLHHLVADKIHARATGPYSLITQQPLGGKARSGGQRFGEMEVWALEAYGAANILQELLTVKSDDVEGRTKIYESMVKGENALEPGTPVSFDVLCSEIRGLGLNIKLEKRAGARQGV
ncbi:MAG: DNA-directed RNA polymerase subunit beta [Planctomycetota bacterium]|jgi:DNA-directed RNA polymerase subunit beta